MDDPSIPNFQDAEAPHAALDPAAIAISARPVNVNRLACDALRELASRAPPISGPRFEIQIKCFCEKLVEYDPSASEQFIARLTRMGVSYDDLVDRFIPAAARRLGDKWVSDDLSFCLVTLGAARLQELARTIERRTEQAFGARIATPPVVIATPPGEQHTLGAMLAASQLRRMGYDTRLELDLSSDRFAQILSGTGVSAVGVSVSSTKNLDALRRLTEKLRAQTKFTGSIALGGAITLKRNTDLKALTGADLVTDDLREFANSCCPG